MRGQNKCNTALNYCVWILSWNLSTLVYAVVHAILCTIGKCTEKHKLHLILREPKASLHCKGEFTAGYPTWVKHPIMNIYQLILIEGGAYKVRKSCDTCACTNVTWKYIQAVCKYCRARKSFCYDMCTGNGSEKMVALLAAANKT